MLKNSIDCARSRRRRVTLAVTVSIVAAASFLSLHPSLAHSRIRSRATVSRGAVDRSQQSLMSRGAGFNAPAAAPITGQVAVVINDNAAIYAGREQYGQLLSRVEKGATIVVTGQTDQYYAVAMSNHQTGFIAKADAELQDVQVTAAGASESAGRDTQAPVIASTANMPALAQGLLQSAYNYLGVAPYVWGGNSIDGIDCSGFVKAVYSENGIKLPRTAADQSKVGYEVPLRDVSQWVPGDRMYFQCRHGYIDHTGMYIGNGYFIHSSIHHHGVDVDKVESAFYWNHLVAVRRSPEMVAGGPTNQVSAGTPDYESNQE